MFNTRGTAVFCTIIILTATIIPPAAGLQFNTDESNTSSLSSADVTESPPSNASAKELRHSAYDALQEADFPGKGNEENRKENLLDDLNSTFQYHTTPNRTASRAIFEADKKVVAATSEQAPAVARLIAGSDARLASTSIEDVRRVRQALDRRNLSYDDDRVDDLLEKAERAYDRGEKLRAKETYPGSATQYRIAWRRAQTALDVMDAAVEPQVSFENRTDPPHDEPITYSVEGAVFDVRPTEIETVTLSLNGQNRTLTVDRSPIPGSNVTFATNVTLSQQVNVITVTATESMSTTSSGDGGNSDDRGKGKDKGDRGAGSGDNGKETGKTTTQTGSAVLRLDGDGLPDRYEMNVVSTDPLDPDSDSSQTPRNESDNGIIDGLEDFDSDTVPTIGELKFGTDPLDKDSDNDRLEDGVELGSGFLDPLDNDSDNDGTPDAKEDFDGDGLTNYEEQEFGTSLERADTDVDGLNDSAERHAGTDPGIRDTDSDGLVDGDETDLGTDPLDPDSDADGVLDGNETYTTVARNDSVGVSITLTGEGNVADGVSVHNDTRQIFQTAYLQNLTAAQVVQIESERSFEQANLTFAYDPKTVPNGNESDLAVFRYNESLTMFIPLNTSIDEANDTVSTTTTHFSTYAVLSVSEWIESLPSIPETGRAKDILANTTAWQGDGQFENGSLVVESDRSTSEVLVVAKGGSSDFERIQPAINEANNSTTIIVKQGIYNEELVLNTSVRLVGPNATLSGVGRGANTTGIRIVNDTSPSIEGLTIREFTRGIYARETTGDIKLIGVRMIDFTGSYDFGGGVAASGSSGNWTVQSLIIRNGNRYVHNGIRAVSSEGNWTLSNIEISRMTDGIVAYRSIGDWRVQNVSVSSGYGIGIYFWGSEGDWTISNTAVVNSDNYALDAWRASGDVKITNTNFSANDGTAIEAGSTTGNWTIRQTIAAGAPYWGISAVDAEGDWTLDEVEVVDHGGEGLLLGDPTGDWVIRNSRIANNGEGIDVGDTGGDWRIENSEISNNHNRGINGFYTGGGGEWAIVNTTFAGNKDSGVFLYRASGRWTLRNVSIVDNARLEDYGEAGLALNGLQGNLTFQNARIGRNTKAGLYFDYANDGTITLLNSSLIGNDGQGIKIDEGAPDIRGIGVEVSANENGGIAASEYDGTLILGESVIANNTENGTEFSETSARIRINQSRLVSNDRYAVSAHKSSPAVNASPNWWGQSSGPRSSQVTGVVTTDPYCTDADCAPTRDEVGADEDVGADLNISFDTGPIPTDSPEFGGLPSGDRTNETVGTGTVSRATRNVTIPENTLNATLLARVDATVGTGNASIQIEGDNRTVTAFYTEDSEGPLNVTTDLNQFSGQSVTISVLSVGDSELHIDQFALRLVLDSDGDGLEDKLERTGIPTSPMIRGLPDASVKTDPYSYDTDSDEIPDDEEIVTLVSSDGTVEYGEYTRDFGFSYYLLRSNPARSDSDGDGMWDKKEYVFGTLPMHEDSDGDTIPDARDPEPLTDNRAPEVRLSSIDRKGATLKILDETEIQNIEVTPYYNEFFEPGEWKPEFGTVITEAEDELYSLEVAHPDSGQPGVGPRDYAKKYYVNITDVNGNTERILLNFSQGEDPNRATVAAAVEIGGYLLIPEDLNPVDEAAGVTILVGASLVFSAVLLAENPEGEIARNELLYEYAKPVATPRHPELGELSLPRGFHETATDQTGRELERGFGWKYIRETTRLSQAEVETAAQEGELERDEDDNTRDIIRRAPGQPELQLIRTINDSVITRALLKAKDSLSGLEVHVIDVGKGSSVLIQKPDGTNILVDAGTNTADYSYEDSLAPFLERERVSEIDKLVLTHLHEDHISMVPDMLDDGGVEVDEVYYSGIENNDKDVAKEVLEMIKKDPSTELIQIRRGDGWLLSSFPVIIEVLNPNRSLRDEWNRETQETAWEDSNSLVLKVSYEGRSFLLNSDIRGRVETVLREERLTKLRSTVVQSSHHGSNGNSKAFVNEVDPVRGFISNENGLRGRSPDPKTLTNYGGVNARVDWTHAHGNITYVVIAGWLFRFSDKLDTTDPDRLKDKIGPPGPEDRSKNGTAVAPHQPLSGSAP